MHRLVLVLMFTLAPISAAAQAPPMATYGRFTVHPLAVVCTDVPVVAPREAALRVVGAQDTQPRRSFAPGDILVLSAGRTGGVEAGQRYLVRRVNRGPSRRPPSAAHPGALRTAGWVTITAVDDRTALARLDGACDAVHVGDLLEPYELPALPAAPASGGTPRHDRMARVLFGVDEVRAFGAGDLLAVDLGAADGLVPGQTFVIYRDTRAGAPLVIVGEAVALEVREATATVLVTGARYEILEGDYLAPRY